MIESLRHILFLAKHNRMKRRLSICMAIIGILYIKNGLQGKNSARAIVNYAAVE